MPYLKIQTNREVTDDAKQEIMRKLSVLVSKNLGKPEKYVMVRFDPAEPMMFAGDAHPCAYLELKSIGLLESKTETLSRVLCQFLNDELKIPCGAGMAGPSKKFKCNPDEALTTKSLQAILDI